MRHGKVPEVLQIIVNNNSRIDLTEERNRCHAAEEEGGD
jgi:hypothetical protein